MHERRKYPPKWAITSRIRKQNLLSIAPLESPVEIIAPPGDRTDEIVALANEMGSLEGFKECDWVGRFLRA